ncbi:MAG TPA: sulfate permease [Candidatus Limnocylindrales bacterium]|nr:sulfate permease [Candidatus Limnocylindrales bacterium]
MGSPSMVDPVPSAGAPAPSLGNWLRALVPGIAAITTYQPGWLPKDVIAGLVLASLLVPQGMAYAELAGLPAITGLYTSIMCLLAYAVFGPSRMLVLGPDSSLGPMIAATVLPLVAAGGDPAKAVAYASVLALMVGGLMLVGARAGLGFIADLLSKPTQIGYMNGLAVTIFVSQLPKLFGFSVDADGLIEEILLIARSLLEGKTNPWALGVGLFALVIMLGLGRWLPKVPSVLVGVAAAMAASIVLGLGQQGVTLIGVLPSGLPPFSIPWADLVDLPLLAVGAIGIAVVSLADTISTSSAFAARTGQEVRANQEMVGIGAANVAAGLFGGFAVSTSSSRTAVAERAGAKSQVTGLVGAAVIAVMLVFVPGLMAALPQPALAAVVIIASTSLADIPATRRLWTQRRAEFGVAMAAFLGVALLGVLPGILLAVVLSILGVFRRAWDPYRTLLGDVPGVPGYHDVSMYPDAVQHPGLVIYRFDAPLIFANATTFREEVRHLARRDPKPRWILVCAEPMTDVDTTAADMLEALDTELAAAGIHLVFAEMKDAVRGKIRDYGVNWLAERDAFYPTIGSAVKAYRLMAGIPKADKARGPDDGHDDDEPGAEHNETPNPGA